MTSNEKPPYSPFEIALAQSVDSPQRQNTITPLKRQETAKVVNEVTQAMVNRKAINVPACMVRRDSNNSTVSYKNCERENVTQTAEDGFRQDNIEWIASLRPIIPIKTISPEKESKDKDGKAVNKSIDDGELSDEEEKTKRRLDNALPPSFYEADMEKWELKFKASRELRI